MAAIQGTLNFFDTIHLSEIDFAEARANANNQGERILLIFQETKNPMTPFDVSEFYNKQYSSVPITSIRRAISDLTDKGFLIKTEQMKDEEFGKPNYLWKLKNTDNNYSL